MDPQALLPQVPGCALCCAVLCCAVLCWDCCVLPPWGGRCTVRSIAQTLRCCCSPAPADNLAPSTGLPPQATPPPLPPSATGCWCATTGTGSAAARSTGLCGELS